MTLTADGDPQRDDLPISYKPTDASNGNYFLANDASGNGSAVIRTEELAFEENLVTGKWEADITIETKTIDTDYREDGEGQITVQLVNSPDGQYQIHATADHATNKITIKVKDSIKPLIKIRDGNELPSGEFTGTNNDEVRHPSFPMTSNHDGSVTIKYRITETGDFLDPVPTANEVRTADIAFNSSFDGNLVIDEDEIEDKNITNRTAITVTLVEDPENYVLSDDLAERSGTVIVNDPSYVDVHNGAHPVGQFVVNGTNFPHNNTPDFPNRSRIGFFIH